MKEVNFVYCNLNPEPNDPVRVQYKNAVLSHIRKQLKREYGPETKTITHSFSYRMRGSEEPSESYMLRRRQMYFVEGYIRTEVRNPYVLVADSLLDISPVPLTAVRMLRQWESEKNSLGHEMLHCYITGYSIEKDLCTYADRILGYYYIDQGTTDKTGRHPKTRTLPKEIWDDLIDLRVRKGYSTSELACYFEIPETTLAARISRNGQSSNVRGKSLDMFDPDITKLDEKIQGEYRKWYGVNFLKKIP